MEGRATVRVAGFFVGARVEENFGGLGVGAESGEMERRAPTAGLCGVLIDPRLQQLICVRVWSWGEEEEGGRWLFIRKSVGGIVAGLGLGTKKKRKNKVLNVPLKKRKAVPTSHCNGNANLRVILSTQQKKTTNRDIFTNRDTFARIAKLKI